MTSAPYPADNGTNETSLNEEARCSELVSDEALFDHPAFQEFMNKMGDLEQARAALDALEDLEDRSAA